MRFRLDSEGNSQAADCITESRRRYVAKADTQETRLEQLNKDKQARLEERVNLQTQLEGVIRGPSIDRQLDSSMN